MLLAVGVQLAQCESVLCSMSYSDRVDNLEDLKDDV